MAYEGILYEKEGFLALITINRPPMNAYTTDTKYEIVDALEDAQRDSGVRAIVFTGTGDRAFSTGHDIQELSGQREGGRETSEQEERRDKANSLALFLYNLEKPTLAAINGIVAGGGLSIALPCDIRIASEKARFSSVFIRRAIPPDGGTSWHLPRLLGVSQALEFMYTGDIIDAREAERIGLVSRVVPHEKLMEVTKELAGRIAKGPPLAMALTKREVRRAFQNTLEIQIDYEYACAALCRGTEDSKEGIRSFLEKREPRFTGR